MKTITDDSALYQALALRGDAAAARQRRQAWLSRLGQRLLHPFAARGGLNPPAQTTGKKHMPDKNNDTEKDTDGGTETTTTTTTPAPTPAPGGGEKKD